MDRPSQRDFWILIKVTEQSRPGRSSSDAASFSVLSDAGYRTKLSIDAYPTDCGFCILVESMLTKA